MNYLPFFIVSLIAYSTISKAESTTEKSTSSTTPAPSTTLTASSSTSSVPKTSTTEASASKTNTEKSKAKGKARPASKTPSKHSKTTTAKPARKIGHRMSHRKNDVHYNLDFDNFIKNETAIIEYTNCFLDRAPCSTQAAQEIKDVMAKNIKHQCSECTDLQYTHAKYYLQHLESEHQEDYNMFLKKYDPDNNIQHFMQAAVRKSSTRADNFKPKNKLLFF